MSSELSGTKKLKSHPSYNKKENVLAKIYKSYMFPNENEKYYKDYVSRVSLGKKRLPPIQKLSNEMTDREKEIAKDIEKEKIRIKKEHDERKNEIHAKEEEKAKFEKEKDQKQIESFTKALNIMNQWKEDKKKEYMSEVMFYKNATLESFKQTAEDQARIIKAFEETLSRMGLDIVDEDMRKKLFKKSEVVSSEIILRRIREKVAEKEKNKKDKEKRERRIRMEQRQIMEIKKKEREEAEANKPKEETEEEKQMKLDIEKKKASYNDSLRLFTNSKKIHIRDPPPELPKIIREEEKIKDPYVSMEDVFDEKYFFLTLHKETTKSISDRLTKIKTKREKNTPKISRIMDIILDIVDEADLYLKEKKVNLVDIPEWEDWMKCLVNDIIPSSLKEQNKEVEEEIKNPNETFEFTEEEKNEFVSELIDYINYLGKWNIRYKGKKVLKLYDVLGNDIAFMLSSGNFQISGIKESDLKLMKNEAFEPRQDDIDNVTYPGENCVNNAMGEIVDFFVELDDGKLIKEEEEKEEEIPENSRNLNRNFHDIPEVKTEEEEERKTEEDKKIEEEKKTETDKKVEEKNTETDKKIEEKNTEESKKKEENEPSNKEEGKEEDKQEEESLLIKDDKMSVEHIPFKLCLLGHMFSGRKTIAKKISEKYPEIKVYSVDGMINELLEKNKKLETPIEEMPKFKSMKKAQVEQLRQEREKDIEEFAEMKKIIEPLAKGEISELPDEEKIYILIKKIKEDFPYKTQIEIENEINSRKENLEHIETELAHIKEEQQKKPKAKVKEEQNLLAEKEKILLESFKGFILVDFPQTLQQHIALTETITGWLPPTEQKINPKQKALNELLLPLDVPHQSTHFEPPKSLFDAICCFEVDYNETITRATKRRYDPNTGNIYDMYTTFPEEKDKKLNERLTDCPTPTKEEISKNVTEYDMGYDELKNYIDLFGIVHNIPSKEIEGEVEFVDELLKKIVGNFENKNNPLLGGQESEVNLGTGNSVSLFKFQKRLKEAKKKLVASNNREKLLTKWMNFENKYKTTLQGVFIHIGQIKTAILTQMEKIQRNFIEFLNSSSNKKEIINRFCVKYSTFREEYDNRIPYNDLVKGEFYKDLKELTEGLWEIINQKKSCAIEERKKIMSSDFVQCYMSFFYENVRELFKLETEKFLVSINIIKEFYYTLATENKSNAFSNIIEKINYDNILPVSKNPLVKVDDYITDLSKILKNCTKKIFKVDYETKGLDDNVKTSTENKGPNISDISIISHRRRKFGRGTKNMINESFQSNSDAPFQLYSELTEAVANEKNKYKFRIRVIHTMARNTLKAIDKISNDVYSLIDEWIVDSVTMQNNAMNKLIAHFSRVIDNAGMMLWDYEMDKFNIYKEQEVFFDEDVFNEDRDEYDEYVAREINYISYVEMLEKLYSEIKINVIENFYISQTCFIDVFIKKGISHLNQDLLKKGMLYKLSYSHYFKLVKLIINEKGYIDIRPLFALLSLLKFKLLDEDDAEGILEEVQDEIKFHCYISKEVYEGISFWFEKDEEKINEKFLEEEDKNPKNPHSVKDFLYTIFKNINGEVNIVEMLDIMTLKKFKKDSYSSFSFKTYLDILAK